MSTTHDHVPTTQLKRENLTASPFSLSPVVASLLNLVLIIPWCVFYTCITYVGVSKQGITLFYTFSFLPSRYLFPSSCLFSHEVLLHIFKNSYKRYVPHVSLCTIFWFLLSIMF